MQQDADITPVQEVGLQLPDGTEVFAPETFHGRPVDTNEGRQSILEALSTSEANLCYPSGQLVANYSWVVRDVEVITIRKSISQELRPVTDESLTSIEEPVLPDSDTLVVDAGPVDT